MSPTRDFWSDLERFLATGSDARLAEAQAAVFDLRRVPADRAVRADLKTVYRLIVDELRARAALAHGATPGTRPAAPA